MNSQKPNRAIEIQQEILESMSDFLEEGIFRSTEAGLVYANHAFVTMFGYSSLRELVHAPGNSLYAEEEMRKFLLQMVNVHGIIRNQRVLYRKKDGRNFWGLLTTRKIERNEQVFYEGRIIDLTTQIESERQLQDKTNQLEKLSMELDRFIYSASHDIRAPISTLMGIINLMKLELQDEQIFRYIHMMERSINKLDTFVYSLISHTKNTKTPVDDSAIDLEQAFSDLLREFRNTHTGGKDVTVTIECDNRFVFYSDPERFHLIFYNILRNAFDYSDEKKSIRIINIQVATHPEKVNVEVFDNGIGISPTHVNNVFEMFYRATTRSRGSGIGLYMVRDTVHRLGGVVTLDSKFGIGTTVKVQLPNSKKGRLINKKNLLKHSGVI